MTVPTPPPEPLDAHGLSYAAVHEGCQQAITEEIAAVQAQLTAWGADRPVEYAGARLEGIEGDLFVYTVPIARSIRVPEFTAVEIGEDRKVRGVVETVQDEGRTLLVALDDQLPNDRVGQVSFDATALLRHLSTSLSELAPGRGHPGEAMALRFLGHHPSHLGQTPAVDPSMARRGLNPGQVEVIARARESEVLLVLGPPGTGKTKTLGSAVAELAVQQGKRVLVTAHTNTALDTALASVVESVPAEWIGEGKVVRAGKLTKDYARLGIGMKDVAAIRSRTLLAELQAGVTAVRGRVAGVAPGRLTPAGAARQRATAPATTVREGPLRRGAHRDDEDGVHGFRLRSTLGARGARTRRRGLAGVSEEIAELRAVLWQLDPLVRETPEAQALLAELDRLRQRASDAVSDVLCHTPIVGMTLTKLALQPEAAGRFDAVVIDEASMVQLPQAIVAAGRADRQVLAFGDPCQLPPVVQARSAAAQTYLRRHPFAQHHLGDPACPHPMRPMLTMQYRMAPEICQLVSSIFYADRLETAPALDIPILPRGQARVLLLDSSDTDVQSAKRGSSRWNEGHADLVVQLVQQLHAEGQHGIGIITPFAAQQQLIRQVLHQRVPGFAHLGGFTRTVHRAQGGEQDVIILDTVDAPPQVSSFLDDQWNADLAQLLCVALSRARRRLVVLAHTQALRRRHGRRGALIMRILKAAYRSGRYVALTDRRLPSDLLRGRPQVDHRVPTRTIGAPTSFRR